MRRASLKFSVSILTLCTAAAACYLALPDNPAYGQARGGRGAAGRGGAGGGATAGVYRSRVTPNWFDNGEKFWYRNDLRAGAREFILVDAQAATRKPAFDHERLAMALTRVTNAPAAATNLPFSAIEFVDAGKAIRFTIGGAAGRGGAGVGGEPAGPAVGTSYRCDLATYEIKVDTGSPVQGAQADVPEDVYLARMAQGTLDLNQASPFIAAERIDALLEEYASPFFQEAAGGAAAGAGGAGGAAAGGAAGGARGGRGGAAGGGGGGRGGGRGAGGGQATATSANGQWTATVRDYNIFLRNTAGAESQLTTDGVAGDTYGRLTFSPDSTGLIAFRTTPPQPVEETQTNYLVTVAPATATSPGGIGRSPVESRQYTLPGDKFAEHEISLFDVAAKKQVKPDINRWDMGAGGGPPQTNIRRWMADGVHFIIEKYDRSHQRARIMKINARTGQVTNLVDDKADGVKQKFIWTAHADTGFSLFYDATQQTAATNRLRDENEMIYISEMDGWRHMYLSNAATGELKQIDKGEWALQGINRIDAAKRQIWFQADGVYPGQDPYLIHYGRVNFDGTGLTWLTAGDGNHSLTFPAADSPGSFSPAATNAEPKYIIDTFNRVDLPPVTELRRVSDGKLVVELEKAEMDNPGNLPKVFKTTGRDDKTEIWGIIATPGNLDPNRKYPVVEDIYAGPHGSFAPKTFSATARYTDLTSRGFIAVKVDGMGTANRSKAFHDMCWQNIKDAGFVDRIKWMKAAAAEIPAMDLTRVGIYGTSAGGQNAAAAVLFHPEFYKVAIANSGCHDNRMDKASWNEQWMGYPLGQHYSASSNIDNAYRLQGRLQLVVGDHDTNVPPDSTFRLVDALVKAGREFEFVMIPGADHGAASSITTRKRFDFLTRYLLGTEPSNPNGTPAQPPGQGRGGAGRGG